MNPQSSSRQLTPWQREGRCRLMSAPSPVPLDVRKLAADLGELFDRDQELTVTLADAQRRLLDRNDQLTAGLSAGALKALYGPSGPDLGLSARKPAVLQSDQPIAALERVAEKIRHAFIDYQNAGETRRQLAMDVGETLGRLITVMTVAGYTAEQARHADVRALAAGVPPG
jgi:hypothetical protein